MRSTGHDRQQAEPNSAMKPRRDSKEAEMDDTATIEFDLTPPTGDQLRELSADLTEEERHVLLEHGTEAPFCGVFLDEKRPGVFTCRLCGLPLFNGGEKFESGTGWPSFTSPFAEGHLEYIRDTSYGMVRTEIVCALRVAPGSRVSRWPTSNRPALLHQFSQPRFYARGRRSPGQARQGNAGRGSCE